ncbi:phage antirepressor KilAC domain-containing protein [Tsukamurella ocularis]|uniref:hypothetical protein n=1 Tax=Tsukamurella ocularis TaxID=1970234 RepID=UPI0039EDE89D
MQDLTLPDARGERDQLASRTDVLDRVGVLRTLPDRTHVTTAMTAEFYGVDVDTIYQLVKRNRDEVAADGYRVIRRGEVADILSVTPDDLGMPATAPSLALFPRRAVLRVGMLLRDSETAREVRTYLLDAERPAALPDISTPGGVLVMADMFAATARQLVAATEQIERERPLVERAKTHAAGVGAKTRQQFFRELKQWAQDAHGVVVKQAEVMEFLSTRKLGMFTRGDRLDSGQATAWAIEKGFAHNDEDTAPNGHNYVRSTLTPTGQEYAWDRCVRYIDANGTLALPRQIGGAA